MIVHRFTNKVFTSNTYVLCSKTGRDAWVIDPGDMEPVIQCLQENDKILEGILITHSHYDHMYGINALQELYLNAKIYASENALAGLFSAKHNMSRYHLNPYCVKEQNVVCVSERSRIAIGNDLHMKVHETPGHHPSCLSFAIGNDLFTGDALIPGVKTVTILPGGNKIVANQTVKKIFYQHDKNTFIRPGHGAGCLLEEIDMESCLVPLKTKDVKEMFKQPILKTPTW